MATITLRTMPEVKKVTSNELRKKVEEFKKKTDTIKMAQIQLFNHPFSMLQK